MNRTAAPHSNGYVNDGMRDYALQKGAMIRVLHDEPAFSEMFVAHLLARTIRVEEDLVDRLFYSSEKRLARALLSTKLARRAEPSRSLLRSAKRRSRR